jgi:putative phosphoribosyl transferase
LIKRLPARRRMLRNGERNGRWRMHMTTFRNRSEAGRLLGRRLQAMHIHDPVVLALPRGGVPVAVEVARALRAPLDLLLVRKIGAPQQPELAVAAVCDGPELVVDERTMAWTGATDEYVARQAELQLEEIARRRALYLGGRPLLPGAGRTAMVVDDGIATGTTVRAALKALRRRGPARVVLAVPVASPQSVIALAPLVDEVVCLSQPPLFEAVGMHYADFDQVPDAEVARLMREHDASDGRAPATGPDGAAGPGPLQPGGPTGAGRR